MNAQVELRILRGNRRTPEPGYLHAPARNGSLTNHRRGFGGVGHIVIMVEAVHRTCGAQPSRSRPSLEVRRPRLDYESHATALDRNELGRCWSPPGSCRLPSTR
jgi:hypothetical protein